MASGEWFSKSIHILSWIAVLLCVLATAEWIAQVADGNYCWGAFGFMMVGGFLSAGSLFLVVIPSASLYIGTKDKRDLRSLWFGIVSFVILLAEVVLVTCIIPQRGE